MNYQNTLPSSCPHSLHIPHAARPPHPLLHMRSLSSPLLLYHSLAAERRSDIKGHSSMAEAGLDLEDGERYLPSGILLGEDGWTVRQERLHRHDIPRLQSFFSDGVAGLPCYPADFFSPHPHELSHPVTKSRLTHLVTTQNSNSSSRIPYSQVSLSLCTCFISHLSQFL